ncbi:MAG: GH36-type glycosyl hydrolase domain-containing protein [Gemmatimonadales bacterium]
MTIRTVQRLAQLESADLTAARLTMAGTAGVAALDLALGRVDANLPPLTPTFLARLLHQLRAEGGTLPVVERLERWIATKGWSAEEAMARATQRLALTRVGMANGITSLRAMTRMDWPTFVEDQSRVEAILRQDPSGFYERMTFTTRDHYRHVVERLARRTGLSEEAVARQAITAAHTGSGRHPHDLRQGHVGYYLVDDGRRALEQATGYRPPPGEALHTWVMRHPNMVFGGGLILGTAAALAALLGLGGAPARAAWPVVLLLGLLPAFDIAVAAVNQLVTAFLPPRTLRALDLQQTGVPPEFRTAVVIPTMFESVAAARAAVDNLEVQFLANREAHLHFALLSDFTDAPSPTRDDDAAILAAAVEGVTALNARYAPERHDSFYLFHRPRRWNPQEGVWMGWERKRGKLAEFNRFVLGGVADAFATVVGDVTPLRSVRYVITLDADTHLPPDAAPLLIGALAHPLNRAGYDPVRGRVVHGYGILQPRVGVSAPSAHRSVFAAIHSGQPGVDPYTTAVSDVYQDLYGEGSFTGKGIYDVEAFERATHGRFPENALLSHDLIEGSFARAGLATEVVVYDDYPRRYLTYTHRKHRWIRGDWQLLPWLTWRVPGPDGREPNRLSMLSRWKIADNLRRSTVELAQLGFLVAGWTLLPGSPLRWTLLALGAVAAPWIIAFLLAAIRPPLDKSWRAYYRAVAGDALTSVRQLGLTIAFLPHQAWTSMDAIVRSLWRLLVSRRHLLEWRTASQVERRMPDGTAAHWRAMAPAVVAGALGILVLAGRLVGAPAGSDSAPWVLVVAILPLALCWIASPPLAHRLSAPPAEPDQRLSPAERGQALRYARLHWAFFERFVTADTHWLAPDNVQEDPAHVVAMRTSPTNIGLQLLATVSAQDLGFITVADMTERLERTFATLARLRRYRGHFYNWYDLRDLRVLEPSYISTVDSGNLAGHCIALRQACLAMCDAAVDPALAARLTALAAQAYGYAMAMDFRFLFDPERKLFTIGFQQQTHEADKSYYDLLASEARLASFIAVAKNDVPMEHWFRLGRTLTRAAGAPALVSWSGSMFEYLMPVLVMRSFPATLLAASCAGAVRRQVAWGARRGIPWGTSESAFNVRDRHATYQYRAFGVPDLALKRGLAREQVVAPYASALATMVDPQRALKNLELLERKGAVGDYGFRDALDYTRPAPDQPFALLDVYMAHHLGMGLVALTNTLAAHVWQHRFHADPLVRSAELLLHERIPRRLVYQASQVARREEQVRAVAGERPAVRQFDTPDTPQPHIALLGQLPYTVMVSHCGGGYSRYETLAVTRWQSDGSRDATGQFCYVKDVSSGRVWSTSHQPVCAAADWYHAYLATDRVTFHRADGPIETRTEIVVVPEDSAEVRRVTVTNNGDEEREVELTSYGELVLAPPESDRAHPAFSNLFVETEWHAWCTAVTATRRPRSPAEPPLWCVHVVDTGGERIGKTSCETDRARFLGRGRSTRDPVALETDGPLSGTTGAVLDPIFALRSRVRLAPGQSATVAFTTLVATSRERAFELAGRYHEGHAAQRALDLAGTSSRVELSELSLTPTDAAVFQELAGHLLYGNPALRAPEADRRRNPGSQPLLWASGVSGDWPIVLGTIASADGLPALRELLAAHRYWRRRGLRIDLVLLNDHSASYLQELGDGILAAVYSAGDSGLINRPNGVFLLRSDLLNDDELLMLRATARVHITCDGRPLGRIVAAALAPEEAITFQDERRPAAPRAPERSGSRVARVVRRLGAQLPALLAPRLQVPDGGHSDAAPAPAPTAFANGLGGLTPLGNYEIRASGDHLPPAPWANVIANPHGGFVVTERGGGFTWAGSSFFYRLTPWHNDPVSDPVSEVLYLQDLESGELWSATPGPMRSALSHTIHHGAGWSSFEQDRGGLATHLKLGMADGAAVKLGILQVTNHGRDRRDLLLTSYVEWTLGVHRELARHQVQTRFDPEVGALFAQNTFDPQFAGWMAFHAISGTVTSYTGSRLEFLGRNGDLSAPAGLRHGALLAGTTGAGSDPCSALQCVLELAPGESREVVVVLGAAPNEAAAREAVARYRDRTAARASLDTSIAAWARRLSVITVHTPEPTFDAMVNRWALYQTISCRLWARSALYQSGGAYGFRDQLQDVMACLHAEPGLAREHILRAAGRQFQEGDVQHWWHPESGRGVRTRFSDDLVWLPYVVNHYVRGSGDHGILDVVVPYLAMPELEPGEHELYDLPLVSAEMGSIYDHCVRALRRASTAGAHGLPLIGGGDWNDGMNRVGIEGRGESVWLAWFLIATLRAFAETATTRGDGAVAAECLRQADAYAKAVETHGWDGGWYRRAYYDDGTPLGSTRNAECRIDAIAQSWSVLSGAGTPERQALAMTAFEAHLVLEDERMLLLLTPPFDQTGHDPGYLKGYLPGVRENGAQYTHAALWSVLATAQLGHHDRAFALFQMLNPLTHAGTPEGVARYKVEPYVVAADVYAAEGQRGRGGWTWYTGSASWMYRVAVEGLLGLERRGAELFLSPRAPSAWREYTIEYQFGGSRYQIVVHRPEGGVWGGAGVWVVDGTVQAGPGLPLVDDGAAHQVEYREAGVPAPAPGVVAIPGSPPAPA